uniref:TauD/TfdA family dioxygenase n=1 Tax=Providencia stuartii TaxID=588 RepID=A0AAI9DFV4_PROST|nr:TauD/TfdA family dioxygenase [Providencia stuartii]
MLNCNIEKITPFGILITPNNIGDSIKKLPISMLREWVRKHLLIIFRGFDSGFEDKEKLISYSHHWGEIMMWPFGAVLDIIEHNDPPDHVLDNLSLPLHWDGMYSEFIPEFQIFHCISAGSVEREGRTNFVNTEKLIADSNQLDINLWEKAIITYRTKNITHYGGEVISPLICLHPIEQKKVLRYNEPMGKNVLKYSDHHSVDFIGIPNEKLSDMQHLLHSKLYDPNYLYAHQWQAGDIVICDNFSLLHGREAFSSQSQRHIQRVHIHGQPKHRNIHFRKTFT